MSTETFELSSPVTLSLRQTVSSHGWVALAPWHWSGDRGRLSRVDRLASGRVAETAVTQRAPDTLLVEAGAGPEGHDEVRSLVTRWLSAGWDPAPALTVARVVDPPVAGLISDGGGRFLRGSTFYEDFVKTVCTIQISWAGTERMVGSLVEKIGAGTFPGPLQVVEAGEATLRSAARLGFRSSVVFEATERMLSRGLIDERGRGREDRATYEELIAIRGIGPYAASHLRMLLHDFSRIPVDSEVRRLCKERYGVTSDEEIQGLYDRWGDYRYLGFRLGGNERRPGRAG